MPATDALQNAPYTMWTQAYDYDSLNRLQRVNENTGNTQTDWQQEYVYDRYGNRTIHQTNTYGLGVNKKDFTVNTANNRLAVPNGQSGAMTYDNAGNLTIDTYSGNAVSRVYDAENRMSKETQANSVVAGEYTYNGDGQRVRRKVGGVETWQVYGMDGELLAEYAANAAVTTPQKEYGYRNGQLLITADAAISQLSSQSVSWTNAVGVSVSGNSLTKTAADGWGNAGAASMQAINAGDGYVEFSSSGVTLAGLSHSDTNQNYNTIDFGLHVDGSNLYVYESGVNKGSLGTVTATDVLRVAIESGVIKYKKNGALLYTSTVAPTYPLLVDTALYGNGGTIANVVVGGNFTTNVSWTTAVGVSTSGNSLTKTAANGWGNAGAASTQSIASGDGYVEFTSSGVTMAGLSHTDANQNYNSIDFGLHVDGGNLYVYESGVSKGLMGTVSGTDVLRVAIEDGVVKYRKNGTLLYTSTVTPAYLLLVDTSLYSNGSTITNVVISSGSAGGSSSANINWLVTDQLGTPRMVFDKSGSLAATKRHDYAPFGEELFNGARPNVAGYAADSTRQKFTAKERDNETGLDYFGARYYGSTQGRFTSVDPVTVTPGRFYDPQQFNLYAYTRNNPLRFIDPTGKTLTISGDLAEAKKQLAQILGTDDAAKRIKFGEKTNTITVDLTGIDPTKNEGAQLLSDVISSNKVYDVKIGTSVDTKGGELSLVPQLKNGRVQNDSMANLDNNPDVRFTKGDKDKPKNGVDDQIAFNYDWRDKHSQSNTKLKLATNWTTTFHELAEAYAKVDGSMQYAQAHQKAIDRETKLREQRPYLRDYNPGSGPGTNIIIKQ